MAELLVFFDRDYGGLHTHLFQDVADLRQMFLIAAGATGPGGLSWNDQISSFVVLSGEWRFFKDINFQNQYGRGNNSATPGNFGPGLYAWVEDWGIQNDSLSSIQVAVL